MPRVWGVVTSGIPVESTHFASSVAASAHTIPLPVKRSGRSAERNNATAASSSVSGAAARAGFAARAGHERRARSTFSVRTSPAIST